MTTKTAKATDNGRALAAVRDLWRTQSLDGDRIRALGAEYALPDCIDFTADGACVGDPRLLGLVRAAGRSPGFGSDAVLDPQIAVYLDGSYGKGRWITDRPAWIWERHGGDEQLDRLFEDQDVALADLEAAAATMWQTKDEVSAARQGTASAAAEIALTKALAAAIKAWEKADEGASLARAAVTTRALLLQDRYRRQQAVKAGR